jgi:S1-C subfamily serine protease
MLKRGIAILGLVFGFICSAHTADDFSKMFVDAGKKALPAMVIVKSVKPQSTFEYYLGYEQETAQKSGFLISSNGYIATTASAIKDVNHISVTLYDGKTVSARFLGTDEKTFLTLLKIEEKELSYLHFGDSANLDIGEWIIALGVLGKKAPSLDVAVISNKGKSAALRTPFEGSEDILEIDRILHGAQPNEPILNLMGEVVGITTYSNFWVKRFPFATSHLWSSKFIKPIIDKLIEQARAKDSSLELPLY